MSVYLNKYTPPQPSRDIPFECHLNTPPDSYDLNYNGGPIYRLATDRLVLIPFIPSLHAKQYYQDVREHGHLMKYMPYAKRVDESLNNLCYIIETTIRSLPVSQVS
jgi:hypothetical protein